jgi:hypothetical protein
MQGRTKFNSEADDLALAHGDERGDDADRAFFYSLADQPVERFVVGGTAVGVAGAVLFDRADEDGFSTKERRRGRRRPGDGLVRGLLLRCSLLTAFRLGAVRHRLAGCGSPL